MKKRTTMFTALLLAATILAGCGSAATPDAPADSGAKKDSVVFGITSEPAGLAPYKADEFTTFTLQYQIFDRLIELNEDGSLTPSLATEWSYSPDGSEITFKLREGVKFHDGSIMTAHDVVHSYNKAIASPSTTNSTSSMKEMVYVDDNTCTLVLKHAFGPIEACCAAAHLGISSKAADEKDPDAFARAPIATGPYKFVRWDKGDKIVLEAFADHWNAVPAIKNLSFKICLDPSAALIALENGEIDFCDTIPVTQKNTVADNDKVVYDGSTRAAATYFIQLNCSVAPFDNPDVRRAMACAIDREGIVLGAMDGEGWAVESVMSPIVEGFPAEFKSEYQYDPARAKELLAKAGFPNGFQVEFTCMDDSRMMPMAEIVAENLRLVGIEATIEKYERSAWLEKFRNKHDYAMALNNTSPFYPHADYLYPILHSDYIATMKNWGEVNSPAIDAILNEGRQNTDPTKTSEIYLRLVQELDKEMFIPPLVSVVQPYFYTAGLQGFTPSSTRRAFVSKWSWAE